MEQGLRELLKGERSGAQSWPFAAQVTELPVPEPGKDRAHQGSRDAQALGEQRGTRSPLLAQGPSPTVDTTFGDVFLFPAWAGEEA